MDNTKLFSGKGEVYARSRPGYSNELFKALQKDWNLNQNCIAADIGAGTGIFTRQLASTAGQVFAIEPNADMRKEAKMSLSVCPNVTILDGEAASTHLPDSSIDWISAAQAFHWFEVDAFQKECKRILKPEGKVLLVWNVRDMNDPVNARTYEIITRYCPDFQGFSGGTQKDDARIRSFFNDQYQILEFANPIEVDMNTFINRVLSASYAPMKGEPGYDELVKELADLFDAHAINGKVIMQYVTRAYIGALD